MGNIKGWVLLKTTKEKYGIKTKFIKNYGNYCVCDVGGYLGYCGGCWGSGTAAVRTVDALLLLLLLLRLRLARVLGGLAPLGWPRSLQRRARNIDQCSWVAMAAVENRGLA